MDFTQLFEAAKENPVAAAIAGVVLLVLVPLSGAAIKWLGSRKAASLLIVGVFALALTGCGSFSQGRYDDLANAKRDLQRGVERTQQGKYTAVEHRSSLESRDDAMLAEWAHKGEGLDELRKKLSDESDKMTAALFDGDTGRQSPPGE